MLDPLSQQSSIVTSVSRSTATDSDPKQQISRSDQQDTVEKTQRGEKKTQNPASAEKTDSVQISQEAREIARLTARDREVRAHEAAHAAVGGRYAGSPSLTYKKGPDGRSYATAGEVSISLTPVTGDPQATLQKAEIIRAAALAPAQPSAQDLQIAARATMMAVEARTDLSGTGAETATTAEASAEEKTSAAVEDPAESTRSLSPDPQTVDQSGIRRTEV